MFKLCKIKNSSLFFPIFALALLITSTAYSFSSEDFENIREKALSKQETNPTSVDEYLNEMRSLHDHKNAAVDPSIQYVWVLSGRSSYLKEPVDIPNVKDPSDDYNRLELGIQVARDVVAQRSGKSTFTKEDIEKYGPQIVYNGCPKHNDDLKKALQEGILTHYPENKFFILDLPPQEQNTRGQFMSFKERVPTSNTSVAVITHAYHGPRVLRLVGSKWNPFGPNTKIFFYFVDRELKAPGIQEDMLGEMERIPKYIKQGDLAAEIPAQISY